MKIVETNIVILYICINFKKKMYVRYEFFWQMFSLCLFDAVTCTRWFGVEFWGFSFTFVFSVFLLVVTLLRIIRCDTNSAFFVYIVLSPSISLCLFLFSALFNLCNPSIFISPTQALLWISWPPLIIVCVSLCTYSHCSHSKNLLHTPPLSNIV